MVIARRTGSPKISRAPTATSASIRRGEVPGSSATERSRTYRRTTRNENRNVSASKASVGRDADQVDQQAADDRADDLRGQVHGPRQPLRGDVVRPVGDDVGVQRGAGGPERHRHELADQQDRRTPAAAARRARPPPPARRSGRSRSRSQASMIARPRVAVRERAEHRLAENARQVGDRQRQRGCTRCRRCGPGPAARSRPAPPGRRGRTPSARPAGRRPRGWRRLGR